MNLYNPELARRLMHGLDYNGEPLLPAFVSEKLNGLRCVYVPKEGFFSKTGKRWRDGVLDHIKLDCPYAIDGELYCYGMSLQEIVENVGVNNLSPGNRAGEIKLWAFDVVVRNIDAWIRQQMLTNFLVMSYNTVHHTQHLCQTHEQYKAWLEYLRRAGAEGAMIKSVGSCYKRGRGGELLKIKFWKHEELPLISVVEGEGKATGAVGAFVFELNGKRFEVGTAQISYNKRREVFENRSRLWTARIKYLNLSDGGIPLNASVEAIWEEE